MKKGLIVGVVLGLLGTAGVYATLNINTTINNLYSYMKKLVLTSNGTPNGTKKIILNGENGRIDAKSVYVNGKELATEEYVDNKTSNTLTEAKNYTNSKASQVLNEAKSYADQKKVEAINVAKNYTNNHVVNGSHIANGAITEDKLAADLKNKITNVILSSNTTCNADNLNHLKLQNGNLYVCEYYSKTETKRVQYGDISANTLYHYCNDRHFSDKGYRISVEAKFRNDDDGKDVIGRTDMDEAKQYKVYGYRGGNYYADVRKLEGSDWKNIYRGKWSHETSHRHGVRCRETRGQYAWIKLTNRESVSW